MLNLRIALRYLISPKSHGAVNLISAVATAGVAVATAAMIIVLSVFNGFAELVTRKTAGFNPPFLVQPIREGTLIQNADSLARVLSAHPDIAVASPIIDRQVFAISPTAQMPANFRAMPPEAIRASGLCDIIIDGDTAAGSLAQSAIISVGIANTLSLHPASPSTNSGHSSWPSSPFSGQASLAFTDHGAVIHLFEPRRLGRINPANPMTAFRADSLIVAAVYQVEQEEQDRDMLIIPLATARNLLDLTTEATAIALYPTPASSPATLTADLSSELPSDLQLLDARRQQAEAFRMIAVEKWITFLMLLFILIVASFNIISTISLLVVEKQKNNSVMTAMGALPTRISNIFAIQGTLITIIGGTIGILLGALLTLGQQHYGWVKLTSANPSLMAIDHYPVSLTTPDILTVAAALLLTSLLISLLSALLSRPK